MVVQVGLHREPATATERVLPALRDPAEPFVQLVCTAVGGVRDLAGDAQAHVRSVPVGGVVVVATAELRVGPDRSELGVRPRDLVGGGLRGGGDRSDRGHALRGGDCPLQHPVPTHRGPDHQLPGAYAQVVGQLELGGHLVAHGHVREPAAPRGAVRRGGGGSGAALTAAEHVRGHHEVLLGVQR